jgi:Winged helix DNA-binding domain
MTTLDIARQRLHNQLIARNPFTEPASVVHWLGAVQSQDYAAAQWAIGLRSQAMTSDAVEQACASGAILRTHVMRPTWHFVSPDDIRWLLALTAPRVNAQNAHYYRRLELDDSLFQRSNAALVRALQGGKQLTRAELALVLRQEGIASDNLLRLTFLMIRAELDGVICSGARRGKQFTYALLDERAPHARRLERDEALAELSMRYFTSHGPATMQDLVWWSGLTMADVRVGIRMVGSRLIHEIVNGQTYWFAPSAPPAWHTAQSAYLLPNFDEYIVGYTDRSAVYDASRARGLDPRGNILFSHLVVLDGQVVGSWTRSLQKEVLLFTPTLLDPLNELEMRALRAAAERYAAFLGRTVAFQAQ